MVEESDQRVKRSHWERDGESQGPAVVVGHQEPVVEGSHREGGEGSHQGGDGEGHQPVGQLAAPCLVSLIIF